MSSSTTTSTSTVPEFPATDLGLVLAAVLVVVLVFGMVFERETVEGKRARSPSTS